MKHLEIVQAGAKSITEESSPSGQVLAGLAPSACIPGQNFPHLQRTKSTMITTSPSIAAEVHGSHQSEAGKKVQESIAEMLERPDLDPTQMPSKFASILGPTATHIIRTLWE